MLRLGKSLGQNRRTGKLRYHLFGSLLAQFFRRFCKVILYKAMEELLGHNRLKISGNLETQDFAGSAKPQRQILPGHVLELRDSLRITYPFA